MSQITVKKSVRKVVNTLAKPIPKKKKSLGRIDISPRRKSKKTSIVKSVATERKKPLKRVVFENPEHMPSIESSKDKKSVQDDGKDTIYKVLYVCGINSSTQEIEITIPIRNAPKKDAMIILKKKQKEMSKLTWKILYQTKWMQFNKKMT